MSIPLSTTHTNLTDMNQPRLEVALVPAASRYAFQVKEAARKIGAEFVSIDVVRPIDIAERLIVVDLTQSVSTQKLGDRVIAISHRAESDCFDAMRPEDVPARLERSLRNLADLERAEARVRARDSTIEILNQFGLALSAITDRQELLNEMMRYAKDLLKADGVSIYLKEDGALYFAASQNDTIPFRPAMAGLAVDESSLAGYVAQTAELLNIDDVYRIPLNLPYRPNLSFDKSSGYRTRSTLLVPLLGRDREVLGVLAAVNRKVRAGAPLASFDRTLPFMELHETLSRSIASQAAVALENYRLFAEIRKLFDGFVRAAVSIIEARDPSTAGHSMRVADLTLLLARACHDSSEGPFRRIRLTSRDFEEIRYASMLHDFGKVGVPEEILLKAEKLFPSELNEIQLHLQEVVLRETFEALRSGHVDPSLLGRRLQWLQRDIALIRRLSNPQNRPTEQDIADLNQAVRRWKVPGIGQPVLQPRTVSRLCIPRGSLDPEERLAIEMHVTHTYHFLQQIPWTRDLARVPDLAFAHHEKLDGSGYPRKLAGDDIPLGAQMMTITDIFDALTASDRPYKSAMSSEVACRILREDADSGKLNNDVLELFIGQKLWVNVLGDV